jgi:REP element-mobilizing transposase RayT
MPNHVHALCTLAAGQALQKTLQGWKGVSANLVNKAIGRRGTVWQENYFDRFVRDEDHFWKCARYIRQNPRKARLRVGEYAFWESEPVKFKLDECGY